MKTMLVSWPVLFLFTWSFDRAQNVATDSTPWGLGKLAVPASVEITPDRCGTLLIWKIRNESPPPFHGADSIDVRRTYWRTMAKARINEIAYAAERWCRAKGSYPASLRELLDYAESLPPRAPCRFFPELLKDPWDHDVRYSLRQGIPAITSPGPDGAFDTGDDIGLPLARDSTAVSIGGDRCS